MTEKPSTASGYPPDATDLAERALLDVWSRLGGYHEHLVLVGGLAPRYIVPQDSPDTPPHCGTMDIDLGVSLGVRSVRAYAGIRDTLARMGFNPGANTRGNEQRHRFVLPHERGEIEVDFLTANYGGPEEKIRAVQSELSAIQVEGLGLALKSPRIVPMEGRTLTGGIVRVQLRVCRPIPFIILKALAFSKRHEPKDANDLVYVLRYAAQSPSHLAEDLLRSEREAPSFRNAIRALEDDFASSNHAGPVDYARFNGNMPGAHDQAFAAVQDFLQSLEP